MTDGETSTVTDGESSSEPSFRTRLAQRQVVRTGRKVLGANYLVQFGLVFLLLIVVVAALAPVIAPYDPSTQNFMEQLSPPSLDHPMGTDRFGRDIFSRVIYGARLSLEVSLVSVGFAMSVGVTLGLLSGYFSGYLDELIMRMMDMVFAFPAIILALTLIVVLGQSLVNVMIALGIVYTPIFARVTRSGVLSVREEEYITAAKAVGDTHFNIIRKDVLPNVVAPIIVQATVSFAFAILAESGLSFLGLGAPPPTPSWGRMLSQSRAFMQQAWWWSVFPGLAIMFTIMAWNFIGDGLRDVLDPKHDTEAGGL